MDTAQFEQIRRDQAAEGRRRLTVRPGYSSGQGTPSGTSARRPFTPKGHDAILKRLQDGRDDVEVILTSGSSLVGKVVARDKFTITVDESGTPWTIYKHAIARFAPVKGGVR